jgi:hypothetical protein
MSKYQQHNLPRDKFLTVANNVVYKSLLDTQRTNAKNIYRAVSEGKRVALMTIRMDEDSESRFDLTLDHSEFRGKLNFGAFRASVQALVGSVSELLQQEKDITTFTDEASGNILFGVPGFTQEDGHFNALMLAVDTSVAGTVLLRLQYMDPEQFIRTPRPGEGGEQQSWNVIVGRPGGSSASFSGGAMISALPVTTVSPSWLTTLVSRVTNCLSSRLPVTSSSTVMVSPIFTGRRKRMDWPR